MTEEQLRAMTEEQIRARYSAAPAYYLQAKLDKKRSLESRGAPPASMKSQDPEPPSLDVALPGLEILDAALSEVDYLDPAPEQILDFAPERGGDAGSARTQQAILEKALEDYSNWPFLGMNETDAAPEPAADPEAEHARTLALVLNSEPDFELVLESPPELETDPLFEDTGDTPTRPELLFGSLQKVDLLLEAGPEPEAAPEPDPVSVPEAASEPDPVPDNVTVGNFRPRPARKRVVSVVMDRKRPNMVRVIGETTRRTTRRAS